MKTSDIANRNGFNKDWLDNYVKNSGYEYKVGFTGAISVNEEDAQKIIEEVKSIIDEDKKKQDDKKRELSKILISSGFNFDGYKITKYSGYISGDDVIQIDRGRQGIFSQPTNVGTSLMNSLSAMRRQALSELKEAAYDLGCNAVIGVDFDYLTLDPETVNSNGGTLYLPYVFGVTANGNAVIIEKDNKE
ncbi:heavy metal-binding domain-containing protein [Lactococcus lactis]|uniref:Heavy metal-binding domain-containing protein n=1 Tax=Lactococcus lactis TaxID=1358 RepID=A0AAE4NRJ8_9LACT|nr:heavy metal-binding domain-containing protein [Lactococcus lactis]MDV2632778.1 heavy metal-binding domain-containing protein [Lactococcus lactis]